jgi:hypothetical protein
MRLAHWLGMAVLALCPGFAQAAEPSDFQARTMAELFKVCSAKPTDPLGHEAAEFCEGFLLGVVSYHDAVTDRENLKRLICYPQGVTRSQGIQAFLDWAAAHQQDAKFMNEPAVYGAVRGLASKWPCK